MSNLCTRKSQDHESRFDNKWKKIKQSTQIAEKEKERLTELFQSALQNRGTLSNQSAFISALHEAYPNLPQMSYSKIMDIMTSSRDEFTQRQTELLDMCREYDNLSKIPARWFVDKKDLSTKCQVVTSTHAKETFKNGVDDDVNLFEGK